MAIVSGLLMTSRDAKMFQLTAYNTKITKLLASPSYSYIRLLSAFHQWWDAKYDYYPTTAYIAKQCLSVPATSAQSEFD